MFAVIAKFDKKIKCLASFYNEQDAIDYKIAIEGDIAKRRRIRKEYIDEFADNLEVPTNPTLQEWASFISLFGYDPNLAFQNLTIHPNKFKTVIKGRLMMSSLYDKLVEYPGYNPPKFHPLESPLIPYEGIKIEVLHIRTPSEGEFDFEEDCRDQMDVVS